LRISFSDTWYEALLNEWYAEPVDLWTRLVLTLLFGTDYACCSVLTVLFFALFGANHVIIRGLYSLDDYADTKRC
jgi:hypothetical protein